MFLTLVQIQRQTVDRFRARPNYLPPYCQLNASLCAGTEVGSILEERVGLKGAKEPFNFFLLECDPTTAGVSECASTYSGDFLEGGKLPSHFLAYAGFR